jgi:hypothetical protein
MSASGVQVAAAAHPGPARLSSHIRFIPWPPGRDSLSEGQTRRAERESTLIRLNSRSFAFWPCLRIINVNLKYVEFIYDLWLQRTFSCSFWSFRCSCLQSLCILYDCSELLFYIQIPWSSLKWRGLFVNNQIIKNTLANFCN